MMKTIPNIPALQNMEEIQRLVGLIKEFTHPAAMILFGHYAGMSFHNIRKGYEILILTKDEPKTSISDLHSYLDARFSKEERREKHLSLHLLSIDFTSDHTPSSYFLYIIRKEGILLYQHESCHLKEKVHYRPTYTCRHATAFSEQSLTIGDAFLADARYHWQYGLPRLAAYYLYQANLQFIRAAIAVHYGFLPENKENILTEYLAIRYCSEEIAALWNGEGNLSQ